MKVNNPFFIKGYHGPEYFCDRKTETEKLCAAIANGRDVTLMAPRRFGKTGLIHNAFNELKKELTTIYIDIYSTKNLASFTKLFASEVVSSLDTPLMKAGKGILNFFKSCRPTATPTADGSMKWSFDIASSAAESTLKDTINYLANCEKECVIAIDEFQQIREFPETGAEALLRGYIQNLEHTHFIFAGSRRHLMQEMFALPRGPFYKSTQIMELGEIDKDEYRNFAKKFFIDNKRKFSDDVFDNLYSRFDGITWYVQAILNRVWENPDGLSTPDSIDDAVETLVSESDFTYGDLLRSQTDAEQKLLIAIAKEKYVEEISGRNFIEKYALPSPSTIRSATADLINRDLVYRDNRGYSVYDKVFAKWLLRLN